MTCIIKLKWSTKCCSFQVKDKVSMGREYCRYSVRSRNNKEAAQKADLMESCEIPDGEEPILTLAEGLYEYIGRINHTLVR